MRLVSACSNYFYPFHTFNEWDAKEAIKSPEEMQPGDTLIIWGGGDISPALYGKRKSYRGHGSWPNPSQYDLMEWKLLQQAIKLGNPIIGVCRGGQMLCAAAGGYLIQHLDNHAGRSHAVVTVDHQEFGVNTIHHQMMMPGNSKHELLGWTPEPLSKVYYDEDEQVQVQQENELLFFNDIKGLAIQWHPEGMGETSPATNYLRKVFKEKCLVQAG